jgi:hypothetical protein
MATHVERTAGPQPIGEERGAFIWMVPLSAAPSREWMKLFNTPPEPSETYMPSRVSFRDRGMVFLAPEERIKEWMRQIDRWIAAANDGVAQAEDRRRRTLGHEGSDVEDARRRIIDADKYRSL